MMTPKKEIAYLLQVGLPFAFLGWLKHPYFFIVTISIFCILPFPLLRKRFIHYWSQLGVLLGKIISPVVMSFLYYLALTPLALLRRAIGSDELLLKKPTQSTLKLVDKRQDSSTFEDLW